MSNDKATQIMIWMMRAMAMDDAYDKTKADEAIKTTPEGAARETIDNLLHRPDTLGPKIIDDVFHAAQRARGNNAIGRR